MFGNDTLLSENGHFANDSAFRVLSIASFEHRSNGPSCTAFYPYSMLINPHVPRSFKVKDRVFLRHLAFRQKAEMLAIQRYANGLCASGENPRRKFFDLELQECSKFAIFKCATVSNQST